MTSQVLLFASSTNTATELQVKLQLINPLMLQHRQQQQQQQQRLQPQQLRDDDVVGSIGCRQSQMDARGTSCSGGGSGGSASTIPEAVLAI